MTASDFPIASKSHIFNASRFIFTGIRILLGWLFLYEGISKLISANWSSAGYLLESHWILSGMFHWIAAHPNVLEVIDFLNIWGLICIGLGLFLGFLTRVASFSGALLLLLYFLANPPLVGFMGESTGEGQYLVVNKNLVVMAFLILMAIIPKRLFYGLDRLIPRISPKNQIKSNEPIQNNGRRELLKDLIFLPFIGGFAYALYRKKQWESFEDRNLIGQPSRVDASTGASSPGLSKVNLELKGEVPKGKIGDLEISRIICGGNLISGYAHSRDLLYVSSLVQAYYNDEKVLETMKICEACGVNTILLRVDKNTLRIMEKYHKRGGKMQWIAQAKITEDDFGSDIDAAIDTGADTILIHGGVSDWLVADGKVDVLGRAIDYIKGKQISGGIAAHDIRVIMACEEHGVDVDYYAKTLNSGNYWTAGPKLITDPDWNPDPYKVIEPEFGKDTHDNIWATTPEQTIQVMKSVKKPWIAFKVLGAGAIPPRDGFRYVFENGADFACVGMFDFQVVENANIVSELMSEDLRRIRMWMA
jgi:uncharacterized membrane protein YphA (DoxX/SURF4 family)